MRRPPTTLGILSIVFGTLTALSSAAAILLDARHHARHTFSLAAQLDNEARAATNQTVHFGGLDYTGLSNAIYCVFAFALVAIGIGLCRNRDWARRAGVIWSSVALGHLALNLLVWSVYWQPRFQGLRAVSFVQHGLAAPAPQRWLYVVMFVFSGLMTTFPIIMILQLKDSSRSVDVAPKP